MNIAAATAMSPPGRFARAFDAVRGISDAQVRVTAALAVCLALVTVAVYWFPIMQQARTNPWWALVADIAIRDQLQAFCLLIAVVIANRAVDEGYPARKAYVLAALVGCAAGAAMSETFAWVWRSIFETGAPPAARPWLRGTASLFFWPLFTLTNWLIVGSAAVFLYAGRRAAMRTATRLRAAELERIRRSKLALESRLQAMQARVEPQFLFNTLAQVKRLYELDRWTGTGQAHARARLAALYGGDAKLQLRRGDNGATEALMEIPAESTAGTPHAVVPRYASGFALRPGARGGT